PERQIVSNTVESKFDSVEVSPCALSTPRRRRSYQKYPCLNLNAASQQREQRILEMLQVEKFLIKAELHRQLESLEKDKHTIMDRKTLERSLIKLQQEGHCKCIRVSVPVVTNCGRSRTMDVVLHPSFDNVSPELLGQIHERLRSFEMQVRGQGSFRLKKGESVPVLNGVQRILKNVKSDAQAERSEAMRANGFVLAKMVRAKLLHVFLWGYLSCLPGWDDALSTGKHGYDLKNPHSTCLSFELEAAIKAMPLELFLQVVGSTQKFEDMISKCRIGLRLSDLPINDYRNLMDTHATARLSYLVDILRRLKLIRIVSGEGKEDASQRPHATLTYALELKPYIEEPVAMAAPSSGFINLDIRPQIRHDFVLSSRKAADEYWSTLEYCYAAADSKAALYAFPGSAVHEIDQAGKKLPGLIFLFRSWASVRVMTADQRAELLKRVVDDDAGKKLSFKECEKIAKDLNLTLEQVLRVYYDKRQKRLTRLQGVLSAKGEQFQPLKGTRASSSRKRKRSSEGRSLKDVNNLEESSGDLRDDKSFEIGDQTTKEQSLFLTSSGEHHIDQMDATEELGSKEEEDGHPFIRKCALSRLNSTRQRKFSWTEKADRQLLIEYVRHRAALGAKYHRTDWASLSNLPAPPDTCKRRMALLNNSIQFRKALMRLCNMLTERYAKHLGEFHSKSSNNDSCRVMVRNYSSGQECNRSYSDVLEHTEEGWDDFNNKDIKVALDEVLQYKRRAKEEALVTVGSASEEHSVLSMDAEGRDSQETNLVSSAIPHEEVKNSTKRSKVSIRRLSCHRVPRKYIKLLNEGRGISRRACESLAVSNAAELFKLVFLSTSTAPEVPNLLAETLRRYSEHDLFAAFNYLREKKIMVGGNGSSPFVLSQQFLQRISSSPFPINTGKRAAKFARWLHEKDSELMEEGVDLTADLQCGDVFHLCALISSGELLISPRLPDQGVGEAEDSRSSKRKSDNDEFSGKDKGKKLKASLTGEGEIISRREKGFPGIKLSLSCAAIARGNEVECFKSRSIISASFPFIGTDQGEHTSGQYVGSGSSLPNQMEVASCSPSIFPATVAASESPWEAMACYAEHLVPLPSNEKQSPFNPELFKSVCSAIQKAGDQGLSVEEICKVTNMKGENVPGLIIEVLEAFGRALKVNAYDSVHIVDSLYRCKYFLTPMAKLCQDYKVDSTASSGKISNNEQLILQPENREDNGVNYQRDISINSDEIHRVTILNLPEEVAQPLREIQSTNEDEGYVQARVMSPGTDQEGETFGLRSNLCRPILPWINGDGSTNDIVYKGLVRRVLGIVMQHPGILEDDILSQMQILNPQSCRSLLELMILDNHIIRRKMHQATSGEPPAILGHLLRSKLKSSKSIYREHFFANP
ncbi:hypothetical protein RJ640_008436, partial [Escallonia rubra]